MTSRLELVKKPFVKKIKPKEKYCTEFNMYFFIGLSY